MKVLVLGLNYAPEPVGIGPYTTDLCEFLVQAGHQVEAIAGEPYYPRWERMAEPPPRGRRVVERGVGVRRCWHYVPALPTSGRRILHHLSFALSAFLPTLVAALRSRPDVVVTVTPSLASIPVAWLAARLTGAKLWTHVQDFEIEAAFATGLLSERSLAGRLTQAIEHRCLALSDRVSSISPQMVARLHAMGIPRHRTWQLRNWASADVRADEAQARRYRDTWNLGDRVVVLYSGSIANKQGIDIVVEAAKRLRHRDDIVFVICGQGPNRARLQALSTGLDNIQLHDLQPLALLGSLLATATMHVLPQIPAAADLVLPSKLCNMLASGRPVVATADPGTGIALEVEGCGLVTPPGDAAALVDAIERLADDGDLAVALGRRGAVRARERWSKAEILQRFASELARLGKRRVAPGNIADAGQPHGR